MADILAEHGKIDYDQIKVAMAGIDSYDDDLKLAELQCYNSKSS